MSKKLAIRGHSTRGKEVIELLEMLGGDNSDTQCRGIEVDFYYYIDTYGRINYEDCFIEDEAEFFTLEEFLEKFPYKVGDVIKFPNDTAEKIAEMKWDEKLEDIIYTSVSGWTRPCYVPKNTKNKTNMKTDCPHNTPKSYAVGLKDGKVIDCIANNETDINKIKPIFKAGDIVKLKGCPDKNIFWIVMDVIKDGYIFNDGIKYSFDDQHHYEKSNREVINMTKETITPAPDITANITDKNNCDIACSDGYEFYDENGNLIGNKITMRPKKPKYPKTYKECCDVLLIPPYYNLRYHTYEPNYDEYATSNTLLSLKDKLNTLGKLLICRDAYWKIAGAELELDKPWKPDWNGHEFKYGLKFMGHRIEKTSEMTVSHVICFPTEEMRDAFYENFKDLIEQCKELL